MGIGSNIGASYHQLWKEETKWILKRQKKISVPWLAFREGRTEMLKRGCACPNQETAGNQCASANWVMSMSSTQSRICRSRQCVWVWWKQGCSSALGFLYAINLRGRSRGDEECLQNETEGLETTTLTFAHRGEEVSLSTLYINSFYIHIQLSKDVAISILILLVRKQTKR